MIEIQSKIHDKFSVEFKVGFLVGDQLSKNDFQVNTWIFIPNSLDINPLTYDKDRFYRDIRSNVRLITPIYTLHELADEESLPFCSLKTACLNLKQNPSATDQTEYEAQIKMYVSILKSSLRDFVRAVKIHSTEESIDNYIRSYLEDMKKIICSYHSLWEIIDLNTVSSSMKELYRFGDEFGSNLIERTSYLLIQYLQLNHKEGNSPLCEELFRLIDMIQQYKHEQGYLEVNADSKTHNREFVFRIGTLKKYIESDLYLTARKKKNTFIAEQIFFSLAAGMSMVFATVVAFSFQQKYGSYTMPLFIALVVSYMFKDRIKDLLRYYFAHKLSSKFFDHKTDISIKNQSIGWSKEGFDFMLENKVPPRVMELRNRSTLIEAENRRMSEKIILFRKRVRLIGKLVRKASAYPLPGINDIVRLNLSDFMRKMDNPEIPLFAPDGASNYHIINGEKIYYINFIIQCKYQEMVLYKRYRLSVNKQGIKHMESF